MLQSLVPDLIVDDLGGIRSGMADLTMHLIDELPAKVLLDQVRSVGTVVVLGAPVATGEFHPAGCWIDSRTDETDLASALGAAPVVVAL